MREAGGNPDTLVLRLAIKGGGCSGLTYILEFVPREKIEPSDKRFKHQSVVVVVDPKSYLYVNGTEIGYQQEGLNGGFTINNPLAASHCGCGTSFSPKEKPRPEEG